MADYVITAGRMELIMGRYRSDPAFGDWLAQVPPDRFGVEEATMAGFLAELHRAVRRCPGLGGCLRSGTEQLDRMEELLLEPVP